MCLVAVAVSAHPRWPLLVLGNRDEFHARPSAAADWWPDDTGLLGGRDLEAGGSWLAVRRDGHFAVIANRPQKGPPRPDSPSRGLLVRDYLASGLTPAAFAEWLLARRHEYAGFCLAFGGPGDLRLICEPGGEPERLLSGLRVFSNAPADQRWPKVDYVEQQLQQLLADRLPDPEALLAPLERRAALPASDPALPWVALSPFVTGKDYGTRAVSLFAVGADGRCRFVERRYAAGGRPAGVAEFSFPLRAPA